MPSFSKQEILKKVRFSLLIGKKIKVLNSPNKNYIGIFGEIVLESKNTFILKIDNKYKRILKKGLVIELELEKDLVLEIDVDKVLSNTLIERIKKMKI